MIKTEDCCNLDISWIISEVVIGAGRIWIICTGLEKKNADSVTSVETGLYTISSAQLLRPG